MSGPGTARRSGRWRPVLLAARLASPLALLGLLLWQIPPGRLLETWSGLSPAVVMGALALVAVAQVLSTLKWHLFMKALGGQPALPWSLRTYWAGMFVGTAFPWAYGGDAMRAYLASRDASMSLWQGTRSVLLERGSGYLALGLMAIVGLASLRLPLWSAALTAVVALGCLALGRRVSRAWWGLLPRRLRELLPGAAVSVLLGPALCLSLAFYLLYLGALGLLLYGLQAHTAPGFLAVAAFVSATLSLLPLSIWGIGVHEASLAVLLTAGGMEQSTAAAAALAFGLLFSCLGTLGGLALLPWPSTGVPRDLRGQPPTREGDSGARCPRRPSGPGAGLDRP